MITLTHPRSGSPATPKIYAHADAALRVLLVEPDRGLAHTVARALDRRSAAGAPTTLQMVDTLEAALHVLERWTPDLVLTEYELPDGKGDELLCELVLRWPNVQRLLWSRMSAVDAGPLADEVLRKPAHDAELRAAFGRAVERRAAR